MVNLSADMSNVAQQIRAPAGLCRCFCIVLPALVVPEGVGGIEVGGRAGICQAVHLLKIPSDGGMDTPVQGAYLSGGTYCAFGWRPPSLAAVLLGSPQTDSICSPPRARTACKLRLTFLPHNLNQQRLANRWSDLDAAAFHPPAGPHSGQL